MAADGVIRERLPDETLLVFLSDTHIGGSSGSDIFDSAAELAMLLEDLHHHEGPVELVLAGDFLDLLRIEDVGGGDAVAATLARSEFRELFASLRAFAAAEGHRVVYVVGNHDAELWWNPRIRGTLQQAGLVEQFGGELVKTTGDGLLATFDGPGRAIRCAAALSDELAGIDLQIRAGLHTGEIELRDGDVGGIAVHIAARVMAAAAPGELLTSSTVRDLVVGSDIAMTDRGPHPLKGIEGSWQLYGASP